MREGIPLPHKIENAPSLLPGLELYYIAFIDLMASRQMGFAVGAIQWEVVQYYCDSHRLRKDQCDDMHYHIKNLDTFYINHSAKK